MIDSQIMGASLVVLLGLGLLMSGSGEAQAQSVDLGGIGQIVENFVEMLGSGEAETGEIGIQGELSLNNSGQSLKLANSTIEGENLTRFEIAGTSFRTDQDIVVKEFNGEMIMGNTSRFIGAAKTVDNAGFEAENVEKFSSETAGKVEVTVRNPVSFRLETSEAEFETVNATNKIDQDQTVNVKGFTGDLSYSPGSMRLNIDGNVSRLAAGRLRID